MNDGTPTSDDADPTVFSGADRRTTSSVRLIDRATVLASLTDAAQRAGSGSRTVVVIEADAGMGKSFLLDQLPPMFQRLGFEVLPVAHDRLAAGRPLSGFRSHLPFEFADDSANNPSGLFGFVNRAIYDIIQRFAAHLEAKSAEMPLAIVVDDLQFADLSTVHLVAGLVRQLEGLPVLFVLASRVASRPEAVDDLFASLPGNATFRHRLNGLSNESIVAWATSFLGRVPTVSERSVLARSGGSPLFVQALLERLLERSGDDPESLSPEFRQFVLDQLAPLSTETRNILEMASLAERGFTVSELSALTDLSTPVLWGHLRDAVEQGMLIETPVGFDFRHDLVKSAIYEALPREVLQKLHLHAATVLISNGADAVQIANHFARAGSDAGIEALPWLRLASRRLAGHDAREALGMIRFASELCPEGHPDHFLIAAEQVYALCWADRFADAIELVDRSLPLAETPAARVELQLAKARALMVIGQASAAAETIGRCLNEQPDRDREQLIKALQGFAHFLAGDHGTATLFVSPLSQASDVAPLTGALANLVQAQVHNGRLEVREAQKAMKRALAISEREVTGEIAGYMIHNHRFFIANSSDELDEMAAAVRDGFHTAERLHLNWSLSMYHGSEAMRFREMGLLDAALAEAQTGLLVADETRSSVGTALCVAVMTWVHLRRGDVAEAQRSFDDGLRWRTSVAAAVGLDELLLVESGLALEAGDVEKARATIEFLWDYVASGNLEIFSRGLLMPYLRLVVQMKDDARVATVLESVERWQNRSATEVPSFAALWLQARAVGTSSLEDMKASLEIWRTSWRRIRFADALVDGVSVAAAAGAKNLSKAWATEAREIFANAGAYGSLMRLNNLGRDLGMLERPSRKVARSFTGWTSLSPAEVEVAKLVAAGSTNRGVAEHLLVSPRTIETHLSHVFTKLAVSSRRELTELVRLEVAAV
jgi:DNA-binding CsgD family transcriptional regulator/tetratricopeptide (TPR) repeat protein